MEYHRISLPNEFQDDAIPRRVFVGNFDYQTTEDEIFTLFSRNGEVVSVNIVRKSVQEYYGFVTFSSEKVVMELLNGKYAFYIRGRKLRLRKAFLKTQRQILPIKDFYTYNGSIHEQGQGILGSLQQNSIVFDPLRLYYPLGEPKVTYTDHQDRNEMNGMKVIHS